VVNTVNDFRNSCAATRTPATMDKVRTIGTKSNRSGIGARLKVCDENHRREQAARADRLKSAGGGGYFSQNDLRVHFGLGKSREKLNCSKSAGRVV